MPVLQPAEPEALGRYDIDELPLLQDRRGAEPVLAMTQATRRTLTFHISREVRSYRDLLKLLNDFQTKERDEPRPRAGVLRTREFTAKDAYSFDRDAAGLDESYGLYIHAYDRIFDRLGLEWYWWSRTWGMMGGHGAHEQLRRLARRARTTWRSPTPAMRRTWRSRARRRSRLRACRHRRRGQRAETPGTTTAGGRRPARCPGGSGQGAAGERRDAPAARARAWRPPPQRIQAAQHPRSSSARPRSPRYASPSAPSRASSVRSAHACPCSPTWASRAC